jgi:hypothetical protein
VVIDIGVGSGSWVSAGIEGVVQPGCILRVRYKLINVKVEHREATVRTIKRAAFKSESSAVRALEGVAKVLIARLGLYASDEQKLEQSALLCADNFKALG